MEFGRVNDIKDIDSSLPPDTERTIKTLSAQQTDGEFIVYVGGPKWMEKTWMGIIYPPKTPIREPLPIYCRNFNTVEFGPSFYNIYTADELKRWVDQAADFPDFRFCPKFPQMITHYRRLLGAESFTEKFYESLAAFGNQLGPLLLQLGDNFPPKSFPQLKAYLESLPPSVKVHVEVRYRDWFGITSVRDELFQLLSDLNVGTVITDSAGRRDAVHMELTTNEAFIRFVGNDLAPSDYSRMDEWVERLKVWKEMGLKKAWFFMHQNDHKFVPQACDYLIRQLNEKLGTAIARPSFLDKDLRLF